MSAALLAGLAAGYGVAVPMGPVGTYLMTVSARNRWCVGAAAALGVATVDGTYALIATIGGSTAATAVRPALGTLRWASVAVLVAVALRVAITGWRTADGGIQPIAATSGRRAFATFVGLTAVNPATLVFFAALVVGLRTGTGAVLFVPAVFAASLSWQLALAAAGTGLGRATSTPKGRRITAAVGAAVMLGLAVRLAIS